MPNPPNQPYALVNVPIDYPNPYSVYDPATGGRKETGYTGDNTGYDGPHDVTRDRAEAARQASVAKSTNVSGFGGYKSEAAIGEASRRAAAGVAATTNVSGVGGYKTDAATSEASRRAGGGERGGSAGASSAPGGSTSAGSQGGGRGAATQGGSGGVSVSGSRESGPGAGRVSTGSTAGSGGHFAVPVLLDLSGNGLSVDTLSSSSQFVDLEGDGYQHRTAWAGAGNGVLVLDADGDGKISRSSEFVFTEWDQTATSDLEALKCVFDTNHNGLLDTGDDRWSEFKVMVDGQLVSLASLGLASIGLTPTGSGQKFSDGSAITGTAQFTRTDGSTGAVGDAVLASDANGYIIKSTVVTNGDGSKTTTLGGYGKDGTLAFQNRITVSADGLSKTTQFDNDGNGTYERSQTDMTTITAGVRQRMVSDFNTDGSLAQRTTTTISADKTTVTAAFDEDGDGAYDQTQVLVRNSDGSSTTTVSEFSVNGTLLRKIATTSSVDGLTKTIQSDSTGSGTYDLTTTETTVVAGDGTRTKTVTETSSGGTLIDKEQTVTSADGRTRTVSHDRDGNGVYETRDVTALTSGANGVWVTTVSSYSSTNVLIRKSVTTTSDDGLVKTVSTDLDGDDLFDIASSDVTVVGTGGSMTETQQEKSRDGSLFSSATTNTSADRKTISTTADSDGDGHADNVRTVVIDGAGTTTSKLFLLNPDGSTSSKKWDETVADGLSVTSRADIDGDAIADVVVADVTTVDGSNNRTRTVTTTSANGALIGSSVITTSADSLTQTMKDDINADGTVDRTTVQATMLGGDGSRTVTTTTTSTSGAVLTKTEVKTSADRKIITTKIDDNGDTKIDRTQIATTNADGSRVVSVSDTDINGAQHFKEETTVSANRMTVTDKKDVNGDGVYDVITQTVTAIASTGTRTTTTSKTSSNGTLLSKAIAAVSANGLSIDTQTDADGDGVVERKSNDITVLNADGSATRTVSVLAGTGGFIGKAFTTTSANGLSSAIQADLDGNGTFDRTTSSLTVLAADGSKTESVMVKNANNGPIATLQQITSGDGNTVTTSKDVDGNGTTDESSFIVLNANGSTTQTNRTFAAGVLTSSATRTVSANGLSNTLATDLDGNNTIDQSTTDVIVLNADGSKTETITDFDAAGAVKDKTIVVTSANGLIQTTTWAAIGAGTSRSKVHTTVLNADGSTTETVDYKKADGSLESRTITTVNANKLVTTVTKDVNGDGGVDQTFVTTQNADGSLTTSSTTGPTAYFSYPKTQTISADGLSITTVIGAMPHGSMPSTFLPNFIYTTYDNTTISNAGARTELVQNYKANYSGDTTPHLASQARITTSGNGVSVTEEWDMTGDGTFDRKQTDTAVLNADASEVRTLNQYDGGTLTGTLATTTSANGLSLSTSWDIFGANALSQDMTDVSTVNADGTSTRTVTSFKADGSQLSKFVTSTSVDGRTATTQEDIDGVAGFDRITIDDVRILADGSKVEIVRRTTTAGVLLDSATTTTSGGGRVTTIVRDADGDGTVDQTETITKLVDGSVTTVIDDYSAAGHKSSETKIVITANGMKTTSEWDFDGNGTVDQRRIETDDFLGVASGYHTSSTMDTAVPSGSQISGVYWETSADGNERRGMLTVNGSSTVNIDQSETRSVDGSVTRFTDNFAASARDTALLVPGLIYWKNKIAYASAEFESADGLTSTTYLDFDGNGNTWQLSVASPDVTNYEYKAVAQQQIDGSVVTTITEKNGSGVIVARGTMTTSADGLTSTLLKDADNNGTYEHREIAVTRIDGSIRKVVTDYNSSGVVTQTVTTDVSANGKSTSVVTATATNGTGTATGPAGVEFIAAGTTNDAITGSAGDDHIQGGAGVDTLNGGAGDDLLDGGTGADTLKGNAGNDSYIVDDAGDQVIEVASEGTDTVLSSVTYTISDADVENLTLTGTAAINGTGNSANNVLIGNLAANTIYGNDGNDSIYGGAGNDVLSGGNGNDSVYSGAGNDYINGGGGDDTLVFQRGDGTETVDDASAIVTTAAADISAASAIGVSATGIVNDWAGGYLWQTSTNSLLKRQEAGTDTLVLQGISADNLSFSWFGPRADDLRIDVAGGPAGDAVLLYQQGVVGRIEKLQLDGVGLMNFFVAPASGATVYGGTGNDIIFGLAGNDWLSSDSGDDILYGGAGNDIMQAFDGNDRLIGGKGNDNIQGMDGSNEYVFRPGDGSDYLTDFTWPVTTVAADIAAANALGVNAAGTVNAWIGGYYWQTASNSLLKASGTGTSTLTLQGGISLDSLTFAWTRDGQDLTIYTGGAGDAVTISEYKTAPGRIEKLALDGVAATSFAVAASVGATVTGTANADILFGLGGDEWLVSDTGDDILYGGAGNDVLLAGDGNDRLIGGKGNDNIQGMDGSNEYVFHPGDGSDYLTDFMWPVTTIAADISAANTLGVNATGTVNAWIGGYYWQTVSNSLLKATGSGTSTLTLQGGITLDNLSFAWTRNGEDLTIYTGGAGDAVTVSEYKTAPGRIEKLALDGVAATSFAVASSAGATVTGAGNADILFGLSGNETLNGNAGNDILIGGAGNDTLVGGAGNDTYRFRAGDGSDTIVESGAYNDNDELDFGAGIASNALWFAQQGNDLVVSLLGTTDKVTVSGWFAGPGNVVETLKSGDGKVLHSSDVATLVAAMAGFDPATAPTGSGIQPNDPRLGDPNQTGTIAAAIQHTWMAA
ncbi:hypothetical protein NKH55_01335 [Mesorhizobium opportunistum]|uniref:calcium-binding protein n=1 Tax=Mesorhizobium opportunistum TaxID=593909 RepID=UPI003339A4DA